MKDAVSHLRAGWHGNEHLFTDLGRAPMKRDCVDGNENHPCKKGGDCQKLWLAMLKKANQVFIPMCPGLSGTIGTLADDGLCEPQAVNILVDAFLNLNAGLHLDEGVADEDARLLIRSAASFWTVTCSPQRSQSLEFTTMTHASKCC
jgi:hypothetical protein